MRQILTKQLQLLLGATILLWAFSSSIALAQTLPPCGTITYDELIQDIEDCANPFGRTATETSFLINGEAVVDGSTIIIPVSGLSSYGYAEGNYFYQNIGTSYYQHVGENYVLVNTFFAYPSRSAIEERIAVFFNNDPGLILQYTEIYDATYKYPYFYINSGTRIFDGQLNKYVEVAYEEMKYFIESTVVSERPLLMPGTYTVTRVDTDEGPVVGQESILEKLANFLLPKAHAYYDVYAVTFTLATSTPPVPTGASSVLFLPGIQASRLYDDGISGTEDQVWPPNSLFNNDVRALEMNSEGESVNDIYTRDVIDTSTGVGDVYGGFENFLNELQFQEVIENWTPFAYDWRYSAADIAENGTRYEEGVRSAIDEIEYLAASSFSGKVTIIGHSNGGLLAKAIMNELEVQEKTDLIDTVILLASPQLGTPKAIGTILHGYDQTDKLGGIIINGQTAREVINNMPGAYGLLPAEKYFEGLNEPLITFTNNATTEPYRTVYGDTINTYERYVQFLRGEDTFERGLSEEISLPARANSDMLSQALAMHDNKLDDWVAPAGVKVVEIVGTGLPTMKSVEYREIVEEKCASAGPAGLICVTESEMKPYAVLTRYGDGTVLQRSAEGYGGEKEKYFLNLDGLNIDRVGEGQEPIFHHSITEDAGLQTLISNIILGTTTDSSAFISNTHTEFNSVYDIEIIDSPVRLLATDAFGNETGIVLVDGVRTIKEDIPGSQYFEFGDTKYLVVPKGTNRTTKLYGEDYGGYTLTTALLGENDTQIIQTQLINASTTPSLIVEYSNTGSIYSSIATDINGDGNVDFETTMDGTLLEQQATYSDLIETIKNSSLANWQEVPLVILVKKAEFYSLKIPVKQTYLKLEDSFLKASTELIKYYVRKRYLTEIETAPILNMINVLKDKQ